MKVVLHPEVRVGITLNVARTADEAERQAKGENIALTAAQEARLEADALFESAEAAAKAAMNDDELVEASDAKARAEEKESRRRKSAEGRGRRTGRGQSRDEKEEERKIAESGNARNATAARANLAAVFLFPARSDCRSQPPESIAKIVCANHCAALDMPTPARNRKIMTRIRLLITRRRRLHATPQTRFLSHHEPRDRSQARTSHPTIAKSPSTSKRNRRCWAPSSSTTMRSSASRASWNPSTSTSRCISASSKRWAASSAKANSPRP